MATGRVRVNVGDEATTGDFVVDGDLRVDGGDLSIGTTTANETLNIAGVTTASGKGSNLVVKGGDATGTNLNGGYLAIKPGMGTGSGVSGDILLQTGPAGASGASQNTATTVLTCTSAGNVVVANDLTATGATINSREVPGVYYGTSSRATALTVTHNGQLNIDTALNITIDCAVGDVIQYTFDTYVASAANIAHFLPYTLDGTTTKNFLPIGVQLFGPAFWGATEAQSKSYTYTYKTQAADVVSGEVTVGLYCNTANVAHTIIDGNIGFRATLTNLGPDIS